MKKILHIISSLSVGGIESLVVGLYKNIDRSQYQFEFAVMNPVNPVHAATVRQLGGVVHYVSNATTHKGLAHKVAWRVRAWVNYAKLLKNNRYDGIHCHIYERFTFFVLLACLHKIPVRIVHCHNSGTEFPKPVFRLQQIGRRLSSRLVTHKLACSRSAGEWFWGSNRIKDYQVVYNGIDFSKFDRALYPAAGAGAAPDRGRMVKLINVGRFSPQKNQIFLLDIFAELVKIRPGIELHLVGFGAMEEEIRRKTAACRLLGQVRFHPPETNVPEILSRMDFFLLPSRWEGFGIVLIEAQAMGLPCIVSDCVTREVDCGLCHFQPLQDPAAVWAARINEMIESPVRPRIVPEKLERFDIRYAARQVEAIYDAA